MSPSENPSLTTNPSLNHFQTPDKTVLEPLPTARNPRGTASSKRKSGSPIPSGNTTRSLKRNSPLDPKDQPTLTQIDFVSKTQDSDAGEGSDDDLDYIGHRHSRRNEVMQAGDGLDYSSRFAQPPRQARNTSYDQSLKSTMPNRKSMSGRRDKSVDGGRRRSRKSETPKASANAFGKSNKAKDRVNDKQRKERNKTLTQMDFVQRWVNLDPDDDTILDYMYTPKDGRTSSGFAGGKENGYGGSGSSGSKRRKLDKEEDSKDSVKLEKVPLDRKASSDPVTPQKPRKFEIPSSQSPESPGFAIISSSQFRDSTRSPLKTLSANVPRTVQEDSPGARDMKASQNPRPASQSSSIMSTQVGSTMVPSSQMVPQPALDEDSVLDDASTPKPTPRDGPSVGNNAPTNSSKRDRTVIYETDGENDSDDLEGSLASGPPSPTKEVDNHDPLLEDNHDSQNHNDSQDLPPINPSEHDGESAAPHSEPPFSSDASLCYRRIDQPTQFPQGPIPLLNTQKMAELFPPYNTQLPATDASETQSYPSTKPHSIHDQGGQVQADDSETQSYPSTKSYPAHQQGEQAQVDASETQSCPSSRSQSLHDRREQHQTQDLDNMSTEIVPESSPVTRQDEEPTLNTDQSLPQPHRSVVQVESSQPADRLSRHTNDQGSYPRGILSKSDLLTSSVMESIPMPQFLMGSQDSVGEPYSIPDG